MAQDGEGKAQKSALCSVEGTVVSAATGEPLKSATVSLINLHPLRGLEAVTDEHGHFAFEDVSSGTYLFRARRPGYVEQPYHAGPASPAGNLRLEHGQKIEHIVFRLARPGVIVGKVVNEDGEPVGQVEMEALIIRNTIMNRARGGIVKTESVQRVWTDDLGGYRLFDLPPGSYYVRASDSGYAGLGRAPGSGFTPIRVNGRSPEYFPGVSKIRDAQKIAVQSGREVRADFALGTEKTYSIRGQIKDAEGKPAGAYVNVTLSEYEAKDGSGFSRLISEQFTNEEGGFEFKTVPPGSYFVWATTKGDDNIFYLAAQHVDVAGKDLSGVQLRMRHEIEVSGRVETAGEPKPDFEQIRLELRRDGAAEYEAPDSATVEKNGTFKFTGIGPARHRLEVSFLPAGWYVSHITFANQDVLEKGLDLGGDADHLLVVKLNSGAARLTGTVVQDCNPVQDAVVSLVPSPARAQASHLIALTGEDGRFAIESVPPGSYRLLVLTMASDAPVEADGSENDFPNMSVVLREKESRTVEINLDKAIQRQ